MKAMLSKIKQIIIPVKDKHKSDVSFFGLPSKEKVKIIRAATKQANKDQKKLVEEFDREYCRGKV